jgi:hypothetical protein
VAQKEDLLDMALEKIMGELDDIEGKSSMEHSLEDCPDPFNCEQHSGELGKSLTPDGGEPAAVKIEVHKVGVPSLDGKPIPEDGKKAEEGLSSDEAETLRKLLKK